MLSKMETTYTLNIWFISMSASAILFLSTGVSSFFLTETFKAVLTTGELQVIEGQQQNKSSCVACASVCSEIKPNNPYCVAFTCDTAQQTSEKTCTFYKSLTTGLSTPVIQAYTIEPKATDVFHNFYVGQHIYSILISSMTKTFGRARSHCNDMGGYLLEFHESEKYEAVRRLFFKQSYGHFWIGANDIGAEGTWVHDRGQTPVDPNVWQWQPGQPDNFHPGEDCATIFNYYIKHFDRGCNEKRFFLCERDV